MPSREEVADAFRRLGPIGFVRAGARFTALKARTPLRRARLRARPLRITSAQTARALAPDWRSSALAALPAVAAWEPDRDWAVATAEPIMRHEFDLLGSGPTQLGPRIDWQLDFKSGRRWPLVHISRISQVYPDSSDIKVPWELSRCQHLPVLAAAWKLTGEERFLDEIGAQMTSFVDENPVEFGACWECTMDVAIRAANWVATLALVPDQPWTEEVLGSLLLHGRFIRSHLEWGEVRANHYLSDIAGLLPLAALFPNEGWQEFATAELISEMEHQVRPDGVDHEMSTAYHRLVTELFVRSTEAARALGQSFPGWYDERLARMLEFIRQYTRPDGLAPLVGDDDSGRYLPLGDYGRDFRDHRHLLSGAEPARGSAAFPDGGFYILRRGDLYLLARCGDTGFYGRGLHSHNDQLSFELALGEQPLVVDPGAYIYTADPAARNLFRSTAFHSTMQIDGLEQNELGGESLFAMPDRSRAEALSWGDDHFEGRHQGFPGAVHTRRLELTADGLRIEDRADGGSRLDWCFPLAPGAQLSIDGTTATANWPGGASLRVDAPGIELSPADGWYSPRYGVRQPTPFVRARRTASGEAAIFNLTVKR